MPRRHPTPAEREERVQLPLDAEEALRALLAVDPDDDEADADTVHSDRE